MRDREYYLKSSLSDSKEIISVHSLDYDGCACATDKNPEFQKTLVQKIADSWNPILLVGSGRQSHECNLLNMQNNKNGCCYSYMEKLFTQIKAINSTIILDKFLMADIFGEKTAGYSFDKSRHHIANSPKEEYVDDEKPHPTWPFDSSKITLIYVQLHRMAAAYPNKNIIFNFYDDRLDILGSLFRLFSINLDLVPSNLSFHFWYWSPRTWYDAEDVPVTPWKRINNAQGRIDHNYQENIKQLAAEMSLENQDDKFLIEVIEKISLIRENKLEHLFAVKAVEEIKKLGIFSTLPPEVESSLADYLGFKR